MTTATEQRVNIFQHVQGSRLDLTGVKVGRQLTYADLFRIGELAGKTPLHSIVLSDNPGIDDRCMDKLRKRTVSLILKELRVRDTQITDTFVGYLHEFPFLEVLDVSSSDGSGRITDEGLRHYAMYLRGVTQARLQELVIGGNRQITYDGVFDLIKWLPDLRVLDISKTATRMSLTTLILSLSNRHLTSLNLWDTKISDFEFPGAADSYPKFPSLEYLNLADTQITDKSLKAIAVCMPNIKVLHLVGTKATANVIHHLINKGMLPCINEVTLTGVCIQRKKAA